MTGTEVAVVERTGLIRPVAPVAEIMEAQNAARDVIGRALQNGRDYGTIPGTGGKPTLLKPGAERLCVAFGAAPTFQVEEREIDHDREVSWSKEKWTGPKGARRKETVSGTSMGLYRYVVRCTLVQRETGIVLGEGIGVCSTMESKYIDRPRELENTVLKMAEKRALIAATLVTFGLSDQFTQDVEDMNTEPTETGPAEVPLDPEKEWATDEQLDELRFLLKSEAFTPRMRNAATGEIDAGMSVATADRRIAEAKSRIAKYNRTATDVEVAKAATAGADHETDDLGF